MNSIKKVAGMIIMVLILSTMVVGTVSACENCENGWSNEGITNLDFKLFIDGKVPKIANEAKLYVRDWELKQGIQEYLIVPAEEFIRELTPVCDIKHYNDWIVVKTNTDVFKGNIYSTFYPLFCKDATVSVRLHECMDGKLYVDAEYLAKFLGADYTHDVDTKTINITTMGHKVKNTEDKNIFIVDSPEDVIRHTKELLINDVNGVKTMYFYPTYVLDYNHMEENQSYMMDSTTKLLADHSGGAHNRENNKLMSLMLDGSFKRDENKQINGLISINFDYHYYKDDKKPMNAVINEKVDTIVKNLIKDNMTEKEKIRILHDYIVNNTRYDYVNAEFNSWTYDRDDYKQHEHIAAYSPYGALILGKGVCCSYAGALYRLLAKVGIESQVIGGSFNDESHVWLEVDLDGVKYHIDPTINDTANTNKYYMVTEEQISKTHKITEVEEDD